jgi:hypothetical protein
MRPILLTLMLVLLLGCCREPIDPPLANIFTTSSSDEMHASIGKLTFSQALELAGGRPDNFEVRPQGYYSATWNLENRIVELKFDRQSVLENYLIQSTVGRLNYDNVSCLLRKEM